MLRVKITYAVLGLLMGVLLMAGQVQFIDVVVAEEPRASEPATQEFGPTEHRIYRAGPDAIAAGEPFMRAKFMNHGRAVSLFTSKNRQTN
jgi:hypothetical protein